MATAKGASIKSNQRSRKSAEKVSGNTKSITIRFAKKNTAYGITKKTATNAAKKAGLSMNRFLHVAAARFILIRLNAEPKYFSFTKTQIANIRKVANPISKKTGKPIYPHL